MEIFHFILQVCTAFFAILGSIEPLQWNSDALLPNNTQVATCNGQAVNMPWNYSSFPNETVLHVDWRFKTDQGNTHDVIATMVGGEFFTHDQRVTHTQGGGIRLAGVQPNDTGYYSINIDVNSNGNVESVERQIHLTINSNLLESGHQEISMMLENSTYTVNSSEPEVLLSCGPFSSTWQSQVQIVWKTPDNQTLDSTYVNNGNFYLAVPNPVHSGNYSCHIDPSSPASTCLSSDSPLNDGALFYVDGVSARVTLMANEIQDITNRIQKLMAENQNMSNELEFIKNNANSIPTIPTTVSSYLRLVNGQGSRTGRLEILYNNTWGTVCDDYFGAEEATVACRQLGFASSSPTVHANAHYGAGSGTMWLDDVNCTGIEASLTQCSHRPWGANNCQHNEDVGIDCLL